MNGLTYIRKRCNISLNELADILGISRQAVSSWENGHKRIPSERKEQLAKFFGIDKKYFDEISNEEKTEILKKGMYRWDGLEKESYLFRGSFADIPESNKSALWFPKDSSTSLDEDYLSAKNKKSVLINKVSDSIEGTTKGKRAILDSIAAINRGCAVYGGAYELFEGMNSQKILLKIPYLKVVLSTIQAAMNSLLGQSNSYLLENMLDDDDNGLIEQLSEIINEFWNKKTEEMNMVDKLHREHVSEKKAETAVKLPDEKTMPKAIEIKNSQLFDEDSRTGLHTGGFHVSKKESN